jgi:NADPH-dependent ferric siderophore reductase
MTDRQIVRMRHEGARRRTLTVTEKRQLTPGMLSIRFSCHDWDGFASAGADDHLKIFVPGAPSEGGKPAMRDYTPRAFDVEKGEMSIDFALHDNPGPVTALAVSLTVGDTVEIGGPRGSVVIPDSYDWYWLIGDETAIPSITRRLNEWPGQKIDAYIAVTGSGEELSLAKGESHCIHWTHRPTSASANPAALVSLIEAQTLPEGDGYVWIAAEAAVTKALREAVLAKSHPQTQLKASGYWTWGLSDQTEKFG